VAGAGLDGYLRPLRIERDNAQNPVPWDSRAATVDVVDLLPNLDSLLAELPEAGAGHDARELARAVAGSLDWPAVDVTLDRLVTTWSTPASSKSPVGDGDVAGRKDEAATAEASRAPCLAVVIDADTSSAEQPQPQPQEPAQPQPQPQEPAQPQPQPQEPAQPQPQPQEPAPSQPKICWVEVQGFRAFGTEARRLDLDGQLVVIHAGNSQGKTSFAEAVEFLLTGRNSRRDLFGGAKAEYTSSLRNAHLPAAEEVYVAAGVRDSAGVVRNVRRELSRDFTNTGDCQSRLLVDGVEQPDLSSVGLAPADSAVSTHVLLQHTLRHVLSTEPKARVGYFKALLSLTDLDDLGKRVAAARTRLEQVPAEPALHLVEALSGTELSDVADTLRGLTPGAVLSGTEIVDDEAAVAAVLLRAGHSATGSTEETVEDLLERLRQTVHDQRLAVFPLEDFFATAVPDSITDVDRSRYQQALAEADRSVAVLAPVFEAVLAAPGHQHLTEPVDCPICASPQALTPARLEELRAQLRRSEEVNAAATALRDDVQRVEQAVSLLRTSLARAIPAAASWAPSDVESATAQITELGVEPRLLAEAVASVRGVLRAADVTRGCLQVWADELRDVRDRVQRRDDLVAETTAQRALGAALEHLGQARQGGDEAAKALRDVVEPAVRERTAAAGVMELLGVAEQHAAVARALGAVEARRATVARLLAVEEEVATAARAVLDRRFADMSATIERWWLTLRPEELVGFAGVARRGAGATFVNLTAGLRVASTTDPVHRGAVGVFSDSQLNALGLATFLARAELSGAPVVLLDDPVPGSDTEHQLTFAQHTIGRLVRDGVQVLLATHDSSIAQWAVNQHGHLDPTTYELNLADAVRGTDVTRTSDPFDQYMLEAEDNLHATSARGRRAACSSFRSAAERLAKQIIATGRTEDGVPTTVTEVDQEASLLGKLVPLVRAYSVDNTEKGNWENFAKVLNPGAHDDDDVPPAVTLKVVRGNLRTIARNHKKRWPNGLLS